MIALVDVSAGSSWAQMYDSFQKTGGPTVFTLDKHRFRPRSSKFDHFIRTFRCSLEGWSVCLSLVERFVSRACGSFCVVEVFYFNFVAMWVSPELKFLLQRSNIKWMMLWKVMLVQFGVEYPNGLKMSSVTYIAFDNCLLFVTETQCNTHFLSYSWSCSSAKIFTGPQMLWYARVCSCLLTR